jgi:hypothetical protein
MHNSTRPKRVLILYTGGTIGMKPTGDARGDATGNTSGSLAPVAGYLPAVMAELPELNPLLNPDAPTFDLLEYDPLIDRPVLSQVMTRCALLIWTMMVSRAIFSIRTQRY